MTRMAKCASVPTLFLDIDFVLFAQFTMQVFFRRLWCRMHKLPMDDETRRPRRKNARAVPRKPRGPYKKKKRHVDLEGSDEDNDDAMEDEETETEDEEDFPRMTVMTESLLPGQPSQKELRARRLFRLYGTKVVFDWPRVTTSIGYQKCSATHEASWLKSLASRRMNLWMDTMAGKNLLSVKLGFVVLSANLFRPQNVQEDAFIFPIPCLKFMRK